MHPTATPTLLDPRQPGLLVRYADGLLQFAVAPTVPTAQRAVRVSWKADGRFSAAGQSFVRIVTAGNGVNIGGIGVDPDLELVTPPKVSDDPRVDDDRPRGNVDRLRNDADRPRNDADRPRNDADRPRGQPHALADALDGYGLGSTASAVRKAGS